MAAPMTAKNMSKKIPMSANGARNRPGLPAVLQADPESQPSFRSQR